MPAATPGGPPLDYGHEARGTRGNGARRGDAPRGASRGAARGPVELRTGVGTSIAQHGELLQGQLEDGQRRPRRFLVSLPCERLYSTVTFAARPDVELTVEPAHKCKVRRVVELTLEHLGLSHVGGSIVVETNITEGKGYGSSTADCVAGVLAVAHAVGRPVPEDVVAKLVVAAEVASDNFMFSHAVLFAHREGEIIEELGPSLPHCEVLGIDTERHGAVYTLDHPPAVYDWRQVQCFHTLVAGVRRAVRHGDPALLGRVATASAVINEQFLPKPMFGDLRALADEARALGVAVAHSGTVLSMLFDPREAGLEARFERLQRQLETLGVTHVLRFRI